MKDNEDYSKRNALIGVIVMLLMFLLFALMI